MEISQNYIYLVQFLANLVTLFALFIAIYQIKLSKDANIFQMFEKIYSDNIRVRKRFNLALIQLQNLNKEIDQKSISISTESLVESFNKEEYLELRELIYHYEFIGILVKRKMLAFNVVFDLVPFPDFIWKESQNLIELMREKWISDFWENFQYLHNKYIEARKRASKKSVFQSISIKSLNILWRIITTYSFKVFDRLRKSRKKKNYSPPKK